VRSSLNATRRAPDPLPVPVSSPFSFSFPFPFVDRRFLYLWRPSVRLSVCLSRHSKWLTGRHYGRGQRTFRPRCPWIDKLVDQSPLLVLVVCVCPSVRLSVCLSVCLSVPLGTYSE